MPVWFARVFLGSAGLSFNRKYKSRARTVWTWLRTKRPP